MKTKMRAVGKDAHIDWNKKRSSNVWHMILCPETDILDPDGWDRRSEHWYNSFYVEEITLQEFVMKLIMSSTNNLNADSWFIKECCPNLIPEENEDVK